VADQNRNPGSKQADGSDGDFKSKPTDKEGLGASGGRTGSGVGSPGSTEKAAGDKSKYSAGSKNKNLETDEGDESSGESGPGKSGSKTR
jgi:hypothetical protein